MSELAESPGLKRIMLELIGQLRELEDKFGNEINKANIFAAAGLIKQEIRHSTILAFLLDPNGWHGIGDFLLKRIVAQASIGHQKELDIAFYQLDDVQISTEVSVGDARGGRLDIFVKSKLRKLLLVIENKVGARQGEDQLKKYRGWIEEQKDYDDYLSLYIYLTVNEDEPNDDKWVNLSYGDLVFNLEDALKVRSQYITPNGKVYIEQYIDLVRRYIMKDESKEFVEYCENLWKNYGNLLNKINEHEPTTNIDAMDIFLEKMECEKIASRKDRLYFLPNELTNFIQKVSIKNGGWGWGFEGYPLHFEFIFKENKDNQSTVVLQVYVGPLKDSSLRDNLIRGLRERITQPARARKNSEKYTRIWDTKPKQLSEGATEYEIVDEMKKLIESAEQDEVVVKIKDVFEKLQGSQLD